MNSLYATSAPEGAWPLDPVVLVWPPWNVLRISPFERYMTDVERLNAQARLTLFMGVLAYLYLRQSSPTDAAGGQGVSMLLWSFIFVMNQGVDFLVGQRRQATEHETALTSLAAAPGVPMAAPSFIPSSVDNRTTQQAALVTEQPLSPLTATHQSPRRPLTLMERWQQQYGVGGNDDLHVIF